MTWDVDVLVLTPDDWRLWRELRLAALADAPDAFLSRLADWQGAGDTEARWRARVGAPGVGCFVAMLDGRPCGMVSGSADRDGEPVTWLESVWVRPEARGRGVLDRLVSTVAAAAREAGHNAVQLEVRASNARAAAAYERLGFRPTGESRMVAGHLEHVYRLAVIRTSIPLT